MREVKTKEACSHPGRGRGREDTCDHGSFRMPLTVVVELESKSDDVRPPPKIVRHRRKLLHCCRLPASSICRAYYRAKLQGLVAQDLSPNEISDGEQPFGFTLSTEGGARVKTRNALLKWLPRTVYWY